MRALEHRRLDEADELMGDRIESDHRKDQGAGKVILWAGTIVLAFLFALSRLLASFAAYDDEGYMLLSLKHYLNEGHLYTLTFSQYGPVYYLAHSLFFRVLHFPLTHDGGRVVTFIFWMATSLLAGVFVSRVTRS